VALRLLSDLTAERLRELLRFDPETEVFTWLVATSNRVRVGDVAGYLRKDGQRKVCIGGRCYFARRLAVFYMTGKWPRGRRFHGLYHSPEYGSYHSMISRCYRLRDPYYKDYGGRERPINVCDLWLFGDGIKSGFECRLDYIRKNLGPKPSSQHTIDRIDNDGNYEPGNIKWSSPKEQRDNQRPAYRAEQSERLRLKWQDSGYRSKVAEGLRLKWQDSAERRADLSARSKRMWQDPEFRAAQAAGARRAWQDPQKRTAMVAALRQSNDSRRGVDKTHALSGG